MPRLLALAIFLAAASARKASNNNAGLLQTGPRGRVNANTPLPINLDPYDEEETAEATPSNQAHQLIKPRVAGSVIISQLPRSSAYEDVLPHAGPSRTYQYVDITNTQVKKQPVHEDNKSFRANDSAEFQLYQKLIGPHSTYLKHIRPLQNSSMPILVDVGISVNMIEELVERDQTMVMVATIKMKWTDCFMNWNPSEYNNLQVMAIATDLVWLPDITVVNSPETIRLTHKTTHVQVDSLGEVGYYPSGRLVTRCNLHIKYFPFDKQHCEILLESWIYDYDQLQVRPYSSGGNTVDVRGTYTNHQWAITGHRIQLGITLYDGYNFSSIAFIFLLERKSDYYFMYYVFPQLLLACLQTLSHTLPVEHPGRMTLLTSLFIGTSVTQASVAVHIPKSSDSTSLLQIYMTANSCNLVVSLLVTFFMMYAVLRIPSMHPDCEPSVLTMFSGFFSVTWPSQTTNYSRNSQWASRRSSAKPALRQKSPRTPPRADVDEPPDEGYVGPVRLHFSPATLNQAPIPRSRVRWSTSDSEVHRQQQSPAAINPENDQFFVDGYIETELSSDIKQRHYRILRPASQSNSRQHLQPQTSLDSRHRLRSSSSLVRRQQMLDELNEEEAIEYDEETVDQTHNALSRTNSRKSTTSAILAIANGELQLRQVIDGDLDDESDDDHFVDAEGQAAAAITAETTPDSKSSPSHSPQHHQHAHHGSNWRRSEVGGVRPSTNSTNYGEPCADTSCHRRELKRKWLVYCVAVDKTIMYAQAIWHLCVPIYLFGIVPYFAPPPEPHVHSGHED